MEENKKRMNLKTPKKNFFHKSRRGISPVISVILLVAMVVVIALIIFLWFRSIVGDYGQKFGKNIDLVCQDVKIDASYSGGTLYITNDGNVPVYKMNLVVEDSGSGSYSTEDLGSATDWPSAGLNQGATFSGTLGVGSATSIKLIPVLIGISTKGVKKTFTCADQYGYPVEL